MLIHKILQLEADEMCAPLSKLRILEMIIPPLKLVVDIMGI